MVVGDPLRLGQILWHLVANGVKFTRAGHVEVAASTTADRDRRVTLTLRIQDTGVGIAPHQLEDIFESFRQLETGLSRNHSGLGLGLAVARKLIALLDGSISVESELGQGSVFTVILPFKLPIESGASLAEAKKARGRVLVVDDNSIAQTIACHALRRQCFEVECAGDGRLALQAASRSRFDVILMDLQMPGWDGFENRGADSPIAWISGNAHHRGDGELLGRLSRPFGEVWNAGFPGQASPHSGPGPGCREASGGRSCADWPGALILHRILEVSDSFTQTFGKLGDLIGPEQQNGQDQDHQQFRQPDAFQHDSLSPYVYSNVTTAPIADRVTIGFVPAWQR
jgi:hypothetical protein